MASLADLDPGSGFGSSSDTALGAALFTAALLAVCLWTNTAANRGSRANQQNSAAQMDASMTVDQTLVDEFIDHGVVVIPNVLSASELSSIRASFHASLLTKGCNVRDLEHTAGALHNYSSTGGAGGILDIFFEEWKLRLNEHPCVVRAMQELWRHTYAPCQTGVFSHPFGPFDPDKALMYIDRVCFRVPNKISQSFTSKGQTAPPGKKNKYALQRSLTPHLDCCPHRIYESVKETPKWRPIQAFVALTDTLEPDQGGFEACPGFHKDIEAWASNRRPLGADGSIPCVGDFSPIRPKDDKEIIDRFRHISVRAGDMVCWDFRVPHANSRSNSLRTARECVYIGLLPYIDMNKDYVVNQLSRYKQGLVPKDQWHEHAKSQTCDYEFSEMGKQMMTITNYS
jgi:ectoine hydroxylase-related dioxygenase (phytanoyl-CoA dioxygenase family)